MDIIESLYFIIQETITKVITEEEKPSTDSSIDSPEASSKSEDSGDSSGGLDDFLGGGGEDLESSGDLGDIDSKDGDTEKDSPDKNKEKDTEAEPPKSPESPEEIIKYVENLASQTMDVPTLLKGVKAEIQSGANTPDIASSVVSGMLTSSNDNVRQAGERLRMFLSIRP
jgi:hypothetical protein